MVGGHGQFHTARWAQGGYNGYKLSDIHTLWPSYRNLLHELRHLKDKQSISVVLLWFQEIRAWQASNYVSKRHPHYSPTCGPLSKKLVHMSFIQTLNILWTWHVMDVFHLSGGEGYTTMEHAPLSSHSYNLCISYKGIFNFFANIVIPFNSKVDYRFKINDMYTGFGRRNRNLMGTDSGKSIKSTIQKNKGCEWDEEQVWSLPWFI